MSQRVAIASLGAGRMGRGIAVAFAYAGHAVTLVDFKPRDAASFAGCGAALDLGRLRAHLRAMPIYRYEPAGAGCPSCREGIERLQRLSDPPLDRCPDCGAALERVIGAPAVVSGGAHLLRESHVAKHGFTQYRKVGKGKYEKTAGKGPPTIGDD